MAEIHLTKTSGARVSYTVADGGDGAARCVPMKTEGGGGGFCYRGLQDVGVSSVARGASSMCTGTAGIPRRSCSRGRWLRVAYGRVVLRAKQVPKLVKKLRTVEKMRKGVDRGLGVSWTRRKCRSSPATMAMLGGGLPAAWWPSG